MNHHDRPHHTCALVPLLVCWFVSDLAAAVFRCVFVCRFMRLCACVCVFVRAICVFDGGMTDGLTNRLSACSLGG